VTRAEILLLRIHLRAAAQQTVLYAAGLLVGVIAAAMIDVALYLYLAQLVNPHVAALIVAVANAVLAFALILMAARTRPGADVARVEEIRDLAVADLQADVDAVQQSLNEFTADVQRIRSGFGRLFQGSGGLGGLMQLGPLVDLVTGWLKRSKGK
jgi:hypothetical protein